MRRLKRHIYNNSKSYSQAALVCGYMFAMCASLFYKELWKDSYYHLNESAFLMYLLCTYLLVNNNTPKWSYNWQAFNLLVLWSSVTTLADEVSRTALSIDFNDFFRLGAVLTYVIYWRIRKGKKHGFNE